MNIFKYGLFALLAAGLTACPGPGKPTALTFGTGPDQVTAGTATSPAAKATYEVTTTPANATGSVEWSISPSTLGSLSAANGELVGGKASVDYTPPSDNPTQIRKVILTGKVATTTIQVTKEITINTPNSGGINVAGKVWKWNGIAYGGVPVVITDSGGNRQETTTAPDGSFSVPNKVSTPYTISAVPERATDVAPLSYDKVTVASPNLVLAKRPYSFGGVGGNPPGFQPEDCNNGNGKLPGEIYVKTNTPVGATNAAKIFFVGEGISYRPIESNAVSAQMAANVDDVTFSVPFDGDFCKDTIIGQVVYVERDANGTGAVVKVGNRQITLVTGNKQCLAAPGTCPAGFGTGTSNLTIAPIQPSNFSGKINFPQGVNTAVASAYVRFQNDPKDVPAYFPIDQQVIQRTNPNYDLKIAQFDASTKLQYRVSIVALGASAVNWIHSDILTPGANTELSIPSLGDTVSPPIGGILDTSGTPVPFPIFEQREVTGSNVYFRAFESLPAPATNYWLGGSPIKDFKFPKIATPATLAYRQNIDWFAVNSLTYREASLTNASDVALSSNTPLNPALRPYGVLRNLYGVSAFTEPDLIKQGSINITRTRTCVYTNGQSCP
jgi:hypothetical protein